MSAFESTIPFIEKFVPPPYRHELFARNDNRMIDENNDIHSKTLYRRVSNLEFKYLLVDQSKLYFYNKDM